MQNNSDNEGRILKSFFKSCVHWFIPLIGVQLRNVLPLTLQQHGADVVLALQQQKGVHVTAEHAEKSEASRTNKQDKKIQ